MVATSRFLWFNIPHLAYVAFVIVLGVSLLLAVHNRRLLNFVCALSLLLFVATMAEWVPGYWRSHEVYWVWSRGFDGHVRSVDLEFSRGVVRISTRRNSGVVGLHSELDLPWIYGTVNRLGFGFDGMAYYMPLWFLALPTATPPVVRALGWRRNPRNSEGMCRRCGYDLRATPDRCPECGTPVHKSTEVINQQ